MAGIDHVTGEWWWIPGTRGLKRGCSMKDENIDNKNKNKFLPESLRPWFRHTLMIHLAQPR